MKKDKISVLNWIFLGLLMLVSGLMKVFVIGYSGVSGMLSSLNFPLPGILAVVLMAVEIIFGLMILFRWKTHIAGTGAGIIIFVAGLTAWTYGQDSPNWIQVMMHIVVATNYWMFAKMSR